MKRSLENSKSHMRTISLSFFFFLAFLLTAAADPRGDELLDKYLNQPLRHDSSFSMGVDYLEPQRESIHLEFEWMRKYKGGLASHLVRMEAPPSEKGKLLLVHEKPDGDADYIAYRPNSALKKKVRISGARNYKYKGFTISVQELIGGELRKYAHQFKGTQTISGVICNQVENLIKVQFKNDSNYPRSLIYLREDNGMLQRWELFGNSNQLEKIIYAEEVKKVQGFWTVIQARVEDLKKKAKLVMKLREARYNTNLKDELFTEEYLKRNSQ